MKNKILKAPEQQLLHWILCQMQAKRSGILDYGVNICRICTQIVPSPTWTDCCRYSKCHHWCVGSCALPGGPFRVIWEKKKHLRDCQVGVLYLCLSSASALISAPPDWGCTGPLGAPTSTRFHYILPCWSRECWNIKNSVLSHHWQCKNGAVFISIFF